MKLFPKPMSKMLFFSLAAIPLLACGGEPQGESSASVISVRTEKHPRPPYSEATYYIYERYGAVICTKIETCNKFGNCTSDYVQGAYRDPDDAVAYDVTPAVPIVKGKLVKHACLRKFALVSGK